VLAHASTACFTVIILTSASVSPLGQATVNSYTLRQLLGAGTYGRVYLCGDADGKPFAIKVVDKVKLRKRRLGRDDAELLREVEVMKKVRA